jgi:deoxycytidine triphosphate deaminase
MSVIPLIIEGPSRTVVERRDEFETAGGLGGKVILIQGLDRNQLLSTDEGNVSYDLRVGREYRDLRDVGKRELAQDGIIELLPGGAVIIETEEFVHFPKSAFGQIVPKVSLLQKGISNTSSKVDPGYSGNLLITVFNLGKTTIRLKRFDRFCALYVLQVLEGARPYDKPPKRIVGLAGGRMWQRLRDLLEANTALVMAVLIITTLILVIVQIFD